MTPRQAGWTALWALASLALAACTTTASGGEALSSRSTASGAASAEIAQQAAAQTLSVTTGDYYFTPNELTVRPGQLTVTITNEGPRLHTFYVRNLADTDDLFKTNGRLPAGESETVTFALPESGPYRIYCAIPGHADRGEVGWITVTP